MRVLVCGGRDFADVHLFKAAMDALHARTPITLIIQGGAQGADKMGGYWATKNAVPCRVFEADWDKHGKGAGHIRNQQMLDEGHPDLVVAFPGGRGTANMIERARKAGVAVNEINR